MILSPRSLSIVINDLHVPFHDNKLLTLFYSFLKDLKPDNLIINGDFLDCFALSSFDKAPGRGKTLLEEVKVGKKILSHIRSLIPRAKIFYLEGNHEFRMKRYLLKQAPELFDVLEISIPSLLDLKGFHIEYVDGGDDSSWQDTYLKLGDIFVGHFKRVNKHSGMTAKALVEDKGVSVVQGHVHRAGVFNKTLMTGEVLTGIENGCMCDLNPSYIRNPNWQHAITVIHNGKAQLIPITKYQFYFGNKRYG